MSIHNKIGQIVELTVKRFTDFGYFLTDGVEDVLLHKNEVDKEYEVDDVVKVFLYLDSSNRVAATSILPTVTVGNYGWAKATDVKDDVGIFLNIGIQKEILLGKEDLPSVRSVWPTVGDQLLITLRVSRNRFIYARPASDEVIKSMAVSADKKVLNKSIEGYIYRTSKVGSWIFTTEGFKGFIHESEREREPRLGENVVGRIIDVKDDGSVNISLRPRIEDAIDYDAEKIFTYLKERNGAMPYWDKSLPEDIALRFEMSKGAFKRALGRLMKENKVYQEKGWTYLKENED